MSRIHDHSQKTSPGVVGFLTTVSISSSEGMMRIPGKTREEQDSSHETGRHTRKERIQFSKKKKLLRRDREYQQGEDVGFITRVRKTYHGAGG